MSVTHTLPPKDRDAMITKVVQLSESKSDLKTKVVNFAVEVCNGGRKVGR